MDTEAKVGAELLSKDIIVDQAQKTGKRTEPLECQSMIPLFYPAMSPTVGQRVQEVLRTRWIGQAVRVNEFERKFSEVTQSPYSVAVSSGTAALHLAYRLAGLKRGDEVVSTVLTCHATHHPLLAEGVKIVFADIDPKTLNIDPTDVARKINKNTKAVIVVHFGGIPCDMDRIGAIASTYRIPVIEDAAQALGASYKGKPVGSLGDFAAFSFQAIKQLTTGDGGMLNLGDERAYQRGKKLRWFGIDREKKIKMDWQPIHGREITFDVDEYGHKYQMNDIAATIGLENLKYLDHWLRQRDQIVHCYAEALGNVDGLRFLEVPKGSRSSHWTFHVLVERRDDFQKALRGRGVETNVTHVRNDIYKIFGGKRQNLPHMNQVEDKYICIPIHNMLSHENVEHVIKAVKKGW